MNKNLAVVVGYIMYYNLLEDKINGSFFSKIDKAMEIAESFVLTFSAEENEGWVNIDFEETLEHRNYDKRRINEFIS